MRRIFIALMMLLLGMIPQSVLAQPTPELGHWRLVPANAAPFAGIRSFDLAFDSNGLPVLVSISQGGSAIQARRWTGNFWSTLPGVTTPGQAAQRVRVASDWAGDIVVAVLIGGRTIHVYRLRDGQFQLLGEPLQSQPVSSFAIAIDARGPVLARQSLGFIWVRRWNGRTWLPLGQNVDPSPHSFSEPQSPALAVTGDGKLVIAYTILGGGDDSVLVRTWTGSTWVMLAPALPRPARAVSLGGESSGATIAAYLGAGGSQVNRWTGTVWEALGPPCVPPVLATGFGAPSLAVSEDQSLVVCGIHINPDAIGGRRTLVARGWSRGLGWQRFGRGPINGEIALAQGNALAYVIRADPGGQPWVAWTGEGGVFVSVMVPGSPG